MKFNLKNRPKAKWDPILGLFLSSHDPQTYEYEEWFEGFEKELKEQLQIMEKLAPIEESHCIKLVKQILGRM